MFKVGDTVRWRRSRGEWAGEIRINQHDIGFVTAVWRNMFEVTTLSGDKVTFGALEQSHNRYWEKVDGD